MYKPSTRNKASSILECTIAIVLILGVAYLVSVQDIMTLNQSANDARKAVASLYLSNEMARVRNSLAPDQPGSYIGEFYPGGAAPAEKIFEDTPLTGTNTPTGLTDYAGRTPFKATVRRKLESSTAIPSAMIVEKSYRVEIDVPQVKGDEVETLVLSRSLIRSFHDNNPQGP